MKLEVGLLKIIVIMDFGIKHHVNKMTCYEITYNADIIKKALMTNYYTNLINEVWKWFEVYEKDDDSMAYSFQK